MDRPGRQAGPRCVLGVSRGGAACVGRGTGRALEIGRGEGCVSRELKALGYDVTASDAVPALLDAARRAARGTRRDQSGKTFR